MNTFNDYPTQFEIVVTCASGVEKVVKTQLSRLGYENIPAINGGFCFWGTPLDVARLNINLRSADRVYIKLKEFPVFSFDDLFDGVKSINFEDYINPNGKILVNGKCVKSKIFAVSACQSIVKRAIVDRLTQKFKLGRLLEREETYEVEFSLFKDNCSILLNTSGAGLHKRGYRDLVGIAPIKETLASALLLLSDFYGERPFADPFCGSGTIAIEAARIALNIASGIGRRFAFCDWKNFSSTYYDQAFSEAKDKEIRNIKLDILASDIDPKAVKIATYHAKKAGVSDKIRFEVKDVKNFSTDLKYGTIVTNPPYGERVYDIKEAEQCYKSLRLAYDKLDNWSAFVITSAKNFERLFGKKADRDRKLYNSNKECRFYYYYANKPRAGVTVSD